ncbi:MAG: hypothetical protein ACR2MO_07965 [Acidimicrobiales bacterium]
MITVLGATGLGLAWGGARGGRRSVVAGGLDIAMAAVAGAVAGWWASAVFAAAAAAGALAAGRICTSLSRRFAPVPAADQVR